MKSDTERKRFYNAKLHQKTKRMHVHLSKELRAKLKRKRRAILVREGDKVRIMRGPGRGTSAKVARVSHLNMKVYAEGVTIRTAKGREIMRPLQPSNLLLVELEQTKERKELFTEEAFKKVEKKAEKPRMEAKPEAAEVKAEMKASGTAGVKAEAMKPATVQAEVVPEKPGAPKR